MFHCPLCQHAAHARTSRYITDTTKERYHQCQNVNCSATFITYESVQRYIVKPGEVHAVGRTRCRQGSKLCGCN
ncbi:regulatory protein [Escherichia coli]|nr:regulatory protein [Escherichia coli]